MKHNEPIKHIMSKELITVNLTEPFSSVKTKMQSNEIHHVPVVEGKQLKGIISIIDILAYSDSKAYNIDERAENAALDHALTVEKVMTKNVTTLSENQTVRDAAEILIKNSFNSLPVVNDTHELLGIVTSKDLLGYLLEQY